MLEFEPLQKIKISSFDLNSLLFEFVCYFLARPAMLSGLKQCDCICMPLMNEATNK